MEDQRGCTLIHFLLPVFMIAGAVAGWQVGRAFGILPGVLGSAAGFVLGVPALGGTLIVLVWIAELADRVRRGPNR